jgi:hypothetical protein
MRSRVYYIGLSCQYSTHYIDFCLLNQWFLTLSSWRSIVKFSDQLITIRTKGYGERKVRDRNTKVGQIPYVENQ